MSKQEKGLNSIEKRTESLEDSSQSLSDQAEKIVEIVEVQDLQLRRPKWDIGISGVILGIGFLGLLIFK